MSEEELSRAAYLESRLPRLSTDEIFLASADAINNKSSRRDPQNDKFLVKPAAVMNEEPEF